MKKLDELRGQKFLPSDLKEKLNAYLDDPAIKVELEKELEEND